MLPKIGLTIGDVNGIGPEIIIKAFMRSNLFEDCIPIVYGSAEVMNYYSKRVGNSIAMREIKSAREAFQNTLSILPSSSIHFDADQIGIPTIESGRIAIDAIEKALHDCMDHSINAMVTAPISKEAISKAGSPFKGHTDMLASLTKSKDVLMILVSNTMKVGLVTVHIPVKEVSTNLSEEQVFRTIRSAHKSLIEDFRINHPTIAVLALNPHGGDGGIIGTEEINIILPAIQQAKKSGINVNGPFPGDGFFSAHQSQMFDLIIAMYHDQGLIPFKMQARGMGVNVSTGLPLVRTSPDHGTAYNIAGTLTADASSMREAILLALRIAENRKKVSQDYQDINN